MRWESNVTRMSAGGRRVRLIPEASGPTPTTRRHERAQTIARGLASFTSIIVWVVAAALILSVFGISGAAVLTSAGLIGVALAFGAQNLLRDLINGTFMIMEDQVGVGDVVDLGIASGTVEDVSLRTTRLRDVEGVVWYVPNGAIPRVGNKSQQWSRVVLDIPVSYVRRHRPRATRDRGDRVRPRGGRARGTRRCSRRRRCGGSRSSRSTP